MSEKYWEKRANELEKEKESSEQTKGCLALIMVVVGLILITIIEMSSK
jgi:hypothetical protein